MFPWLCFRTENTYWQFEKTSTSSLTLPYSGVKPTFFCPWVWTRLMTSFYLAEVTAWTHRHWSNGSTRAFSCPFFWSLLGGQLPCRAHSAGWHALQVDVGPRRRLPARCRPSCPHILHEERVPPREADASSASPEHISPSTSPTKKVTS